MIKIKELNQLSEVLWEIPVSYRSDMRVPARIYATQSMLRNILEEKSLEQLVNVSTLPGLVQYVLAMPDIHQGYGFPIGGVSAMELHNGVISPGGVGYDINCGVRLLASDYSFQEIQSKIPALITQMQRDVPSGVGRSSQLTLNLAEMNAILETGVQWAVARGYTDPKDLDCIEEQGCFPGAEAACVSQQAKQRGLDQLGTLGGGNHFLEIQEVVKIFDQEVADVFGLFLGQVTVMIHTGSRGLGHQVCTDYVRLMNQTMPSFGIHLPDRQLACAPFQSPEGKEYFKAMAGAANFAWTNRQLITQAIRKSWAHVLSPNPHSLKLVYDVAHNIAKLENYGNRSLLIHRKGATRAFGPGHPAVSACYREVGQPVLIPGSMGTYSYVLAGTTGAMETTFGSTCHGAGRLMSRTAAKNRLDIHTLQKQLKEYGVVVRAGSNQGLLEEAPEAYKDIDEVVQVVEQAGIARKIAKLKPVAIVKG